MPDLLNTTHGDDSEAFFARPGDLYLVNVSIPYASIGLEFAIKADDTQLPYAAELLRQLRGAISGRGNVTLTKATIVDQLPGVGQPAYAVRPPQPEPQPGKHRAPETKPRGVHDDDCEQLNLGNPFCGCGIDADPITTEEANDHGSYPDNGSAIYNVRNLEAMRAKNAMKLAAEVAHFDNVNQDRARELRMSAARLVNALRKARG